MNILNALQNCGFFRFRHSAIAAKVPAKFARITAGAGAGACLGLATLAMALSVPASAQTVTLRDPAFDLSPVPGNNSAPWVPGFLRDRPLGLVVGIQPSFEGSGDLVPTYGLASDYSNAFSARSPLQTMGSIDKPPEILGKMIGAALVGTFLGVLLAYGIVGPLAGRLKQVLEQDEQIFHAVKQVIIASLYGHPQPLVVESARSGLGHTVRPGLNELLDALRGR